MKLLALSGWLTAALVSVGAALAVHLVLRGERQWTERRVREWPL